METQPDDPRPLFRIRAHNLEVLGFPRFALDRRIFCLVARQEVTYIARLNQSYGTSGFPHIRLLTDTELLDRKIFGLFWSQLLIIYLPTQDTPENQSSRFRAMGSILGVVGLRDV